MMLYIVKLYRTDGTSSVKTGPLPEQVAQKIANNFNTDYQTDEYHVEKYEPEKHPILTDW